jgi:hypothetical protein
MILDERLEFADALAFNTGAPATFNVGDVADTHGPTIGHNVGQNVRRDLGAGDEQMWLVIKTVAALATGSVQFALISDDINPPDLATRTVHALSPVFAPAAAPANTILWATPLPSGQYERYVGVQQITSGAAITAGSFDAFLTADPSIWRAYADNVN